MKSFFLQFLYGLLGMVVVAAFAFKVFQPIQVLPRMQLSPAFDLVNQNDERITSEGLRGKFVLINFSYSNCPAPCYGMTEKIREVQSRLGEVDLGGVEVAFVTISFDPDRDTPATLQEFVNTEKLNIPAWDIATTSNKTILKTIIGSGFETYYADNGDGTFSFDPTFVLVDGWGVIRAEYRYATEVSFADRILRHLEVLADEVKNANGSAKWAYEAAHLFLCYAP
jgi:protein SCO1/2